MAHGTVTVGTTSTQLLAADPARSALMMQNLSANDVWVNFDSAAVAGSGIHLVPNQAVPIVLRGQDFYLDITGAVFAIASAAGSNVYGIDTVTP